MNCEAVVRGKECGKPAVCSGVVLTMSGVVTVHACETHRKRSGFFEDKQINNQEVTE
ncbi:hypothetical protein [Priestia megaterium]|uniref:hypothetical protein n=1 Tax=Priestia megaterium TaxID=1404 RepID=UPI0031FD9D70